MSTPADLYAIFKDQGLFFDLSQRVRLRFSGGDRQRFLQGQVSNDVRQATGDQSVYAAVMNAKGKMSGDGFIHDTGQAYLLDSEPELRQSLFERFDRFLIADDVLLEDVTDSTAQFHLLARDPAAFCAKLAGRGLTAVRADRLGLAGLDVFCPSAEKADFRDLLTAHFAEGSGADYEQLRMEQGIPRYGTDMGEDTIPNEAGLEARAISYHKGCYIGQEVISRIKSVGRVNWSWAGFELENASAPAGEMRLTVGEAESGMITRTLFSTHLQKRIALGYVKRDYSAVGTRMESPVGPVTTVPLPFVKFPV
ncbi:MAG: glycine cleavage T C-terminal barrel domain-containing protein [Verrucomicrobiae bacterium]|nr:glycine cleavage T C-terminal barrel domain-containing protein [Verrucomicrobiae bacterium]